MLSVPFLYSKPKPVTSKEPFFENHKTVVCKTVDVKMKLKNFLAYQYVRQRPVDLFLPVASKKVTVPNSTAAWQ